MLALCRDSSVRDGGIYISNIKGYDRIYAVDRSIGHDNQITISTLDWRILFMASPREYFYTSQDLRLPHWSEKHSRASNAAAGNTIAAASGSLTFCFRWTISSSRRFTQPWEQSKKYGKSMHVHEERPLYSISTTSSLLKEFTVHIDRYLDWHWEKKERECLYAWTAERKATVHVNRLQTHSYACHDEEDGRLWQRYCYIWNLFFLAFLLLLKKEEGICKAS